MTLEERLNQADIINLNDWEAANILNAPDSNITIETMIPIFDILYRLQKWGVYGEIHWQASHGIEAVSKLCHQVLAIIEPSKTIFKNIDITDPIVSLSFQTMGTAMVSANLLTQAQYDELWALRIKSVSWAEYNLGRPVTSREIGLARGSK